MSGTSKNSIHFIDGKTLPMEILSVFVRKYKDVLNNPACQTSNDADHVIFFCRQDRLISTLKGLDFAISRGNHGLT